MNFCKNLSLILFFLVFASCNSIDYSKTEWKKNNVSLNTKSVTTKTYVAKNMFGETSIDYDQDSIEEQLLFSETGKLLFKKKYVQGEYEYEKYIYDENDMLYTLIYFKDEKLDAINYKKVFSYADSLKIKEEIYKGDGKLIAVAKFEYDSLKRLIRVDQYSENGELDSYYKYTFTDSTRHIIGYDKNNEIGYLQMTAIDSLKRIVSEKTFDGTKKELKTISYTKNDSSVMYRLYNLDDSPLNFYNLHYYSKDSLVTESLNANNDIQLRVSHLKNEHGDFVEQIENYLLSDSIAYKKNKYIYDAKANWIYKTSYLNDKPTLIYKRIINYY